MKSFTSSLIFAVLAIGLISSSIPLQEAFAAPVSATGTLDLNNGVALPILVNFDSAITIINSNVGWTIGKGDGSGTPIFLDGGTFAISTGDVTITLTEAKRVAIQAELAGGTARIVVPLGAVSDAGGASAAIITTPAFAPTADTTAPTFTSATINLEPATRTLTITASETLDLTPVSNVDLTKIFVSGTGGANVVALTGASITNTVDGTTINITFTEAQRAAIVAEELATTPIQLDLSAGAFKDVSPAATANALAGDNTITRTLDTTAPTFSSATLNLNDNNRQLIITFNEAIDVTPNTNIDLTKLFISPTGSANTLALTGATLPTAIDGTSIIITLTEAQKAQVAQMTTPQLDITAAAVTDISTNAIAGTTDKAISLTTDTTKPTVTSSALNLAPASRVLTIVFSETIDATPATNVDLTKIFISGIGLANQVSLVGATVTATDGTTVTITLTEAQRVQVIGLTTPQLDLSALAVTDVSANSNNAVADTAIAITADATAPTFTSATLNLNDNNRQIVITLSEPVDVTPQTNVDLTKLFVSQTGGLNVVALTGATVNTFSDGTAVTITLTEAQRAAIVALATKELDITGAAFTDISGNVMTALADNVITTTLDTTKPLITQVLMNPATGVGTITISFGEIMDITPNTNVDLSKIYVSETGQSNQIALTGATLPAATDSDTMVITMTAAQATAAAALVTPQLDVSVDAFRDISANFIAGVADKPITVTSDVTVPTFVSATLNLSPASGVLTITFNETIDTTPATFVDLTKLFISPVGVANQNVLTGATVTAVDGATVTITLTEAQRATVVGLATRELDITAGAVRDLAGNLVAAAADNAIAVTADTGAPIVSSVTLNLNPGAAGSLVVTFNEAIDVSPTTNVIVGGFFISSNGIANEVTLSGATLVTAADGNTITITLTEAQRQAAVALATRQLDIAAGTVRDISGNLNAAIVDQAITLTVDATAPAFTSATINLNDSNRQVNITFSEAIDATPATNVDLTKLFISQTGGANVVALTGATVTATDGTTITITLTENQRQTIGALASREVDITAGAVKDVSGNLIAASVDNAITTTADTTKPTITSATLNLDPLNRNLVVLFSETVDATPAATVDLTKIFISPTGVVDQNVLTGATVTAVDGTSITIQLTVAQFNTVSALATRELDVTAAGFVDVAATPNTIAAVADIPITTTPDATKPTITTVALDLNPGTNTLTVTLDETADATPATNVDLSKLFISAIGQTNQISLVGATVTAADDTTAPFDVVITLTEAQRAQLVALTTRQLDVSAGAFIDIAATPNAINAVSDVPIGLTADTTVPTLNGNVYLNNDVAVRSVIFQFSEAVKVSSVDLTKLFISTIGSVNQIALTGATVNTTTDGNLIQITLTSAQQTAIAALASTELDMTVGAFQDISGNNIAASTGTSITAQTDTVKPAITGVALNLNPGSRVLTITSGETIDATPAAYVDLNKIFISATGQTNQISLAGATVTAADGTTITITLTEAQRAAVVALASKELDVSAGAIRDLAGNFNNASIDTTVTITADATAPTFTSATLNLDPSSRILAVTLSEAIDATPANFVNTSQLWISAASNANEVSLAGATVTATDGTTITITLTEAQRALAAALGTRQLDIGAGAFKDLSGNTIAAIADQTITTTADATKPTIVSTTLNLNPSNKQVVITFNEAIKASTVDLTKLFISDALAVNQIALTGASASTVDGTSITITLTEAQRANIAALGTKQLDVVAAAIADISNNAIAASADNAITVTADTTAPTISSATFNANPTVGTLVVTFNEAIDATPGSQVDVSKIFISPTGAANQIPLTGSTVIAVDGTTITITLTSSQRIAANALATRELDVSAGAFKDLSGTGNAASADTAITTIDTVGPAFVAARYNPTTGTITMNWNENIDVTPATNVDLSKLFVSQVGGVNEVALTGATLVTTTDGTPIKITPTVAQKASIDALATKQLDYSAGLVKDVSGNANTADVDKALTIANDITAPVITSPIDGVTQESGIVSVVGTYATEATTLDVIVDDLVVATQTTDGSLAFTMNTTTLTNGVHSLTVRATDAFGESASSTAISITIGIVPTLSPVSITSSNSNPAVAVPGDTVTLTFTGSVTLQNVLVTINGNSAVATLNVNQWTATRVMQTGDTAGPVAFTIDFESLAGVAGVPVTATTDSSSVTLTVTPSFTAWTQKVIDLRNSKSASFQSTFPISTNAEINTLLAWAGNPTAQTNNAALDEFGHMYSPMKRWNERADLQSVFPEASLGADEVKLVTWAGKDTVLANPGNSDLLPHEETYVLLRIYFLERDDLRSNDAFNGADDGSDPSRLYCWAQNSQDSRLTPHQAFYAANCVP